MEKDELWERFVSWENLAAAAREAARRKRRRPDVIEFERRREENLAELREELISGAYVPGPYRSFSIYDPKPRVISAPAYRDRIVHHALVRVAGPVWERRFVHHNYACREGKGLHRAALACQRFARRFPWALRVDVRKFYDSVDHAVLKALYRRDLGASRVIDVLDRVVDTCDSGVPGRGIPIGALTSQWFALRMLDPVDHLLVDRLGVPMVRYMDDLFCFGTTKAGLRKLLEAVREELRRLKLEAHPDKQQIMAVAGGLPFVGFRIFPTHMRVRSASKSRAARRMKAWSVLSRSGEVATERLRSAVASWFGHWKWANAYYLRKATICALKF